MEMYHAEQLLVVLIKLLEESTQARLSEYLDRVIFDAALAGTIKKCKMPNWFTELFDMNPVHGIMSPIRQLLFVAQRDMLMTRYGVQMKLRVEIGIPEAQQMCKRINVEFEDVKQWALRLEKEINLTETRCAKEGRRYA